MTFVESRMNGSADFRVGVNIFRVGSDQGGNFSRFGWEVHLTAYPQQYGTWMEGPQQWRALVGGQERSGTFELLYSERYNSHRIIASGYVDVPHDANGFRPGFPNSAYIGTSHSSVGSGWSGDAWIDAPRIPKRPAQTSSVGAATIDHQAVRVTWAWPNDNGAALDVGEIQAATDAGFTQNVRTRSYAGAPTIDITGLTPGTRWYFRVRSHNAVGWGDWSGAAAAVTYSAPSAPGVPSLGTITTSSIALSWGVPSNGGMPITGYRVELSTGSASWIAYDGAATSAVISGLGSATSLSFRVQAVNAAGGGAWSGWRDTATLASAPRNVAATGVTPTGLTLVWASPGGNAIQRYGIHRATDANFTQGFVDSSTTALQLVVTDLAPGTTYYFRVVAYTAGGWGDWSATFMIRVGLPAPTVTYAVTETGAYRLRVYWTAPAVTTGLTGYAVHVRSGDASGPLVATVTVGNVLTTDIDLPGGQLVFVTAAALTAGGANSWSGPLAVVHRLPVGDVDGWVRFGSNPHDMYGYTANGIRRGQIGASSVLAIESLSTGTTAVPAGTEGIRRVVGGLVVGKAYRFLASGTVGGGAMANQYRMNVVGEAQGAVTTVSDRTSLGLIDFVARSTSITLEIILAQAITVTGARPVVESAYFHDVKLLELVTDYDTRLRETVYESSLANHLDLACNSVGATWYVDVAGDTRFRLPGAALPVSATFADDATPGALHYVDVDASYDTRALINRLEVTNYGVDAARVNEQNDALVVTSAESQSRFGTRSEKLDVNLWNAAPYAGALNARLAKVLDAADDAQLRIASLRWNAQEDLAAAVRLEIGQRILVRFRGLVQDSQIVSIAHDITPKRWMVTLTLQPL